MSISLSYLPNLITSTRILLTPFIVFSLLTAHTLLALVLLVIAAITDWLDGWLARSYAGWSTKLGAFLDPMADKILLISVFLTFGYLSKIPLWVVAIAVGRDLTILLGIVIYHIVIGPLQYQPIISSKINTALQMTLTILLLIWEIEVHIPPLILKAVTISMMMTSVISLAQYAKIWVLKIREHVKDPF